jgi:non-ribosomal peptide synthetase component F/aryl carrier-like protein
MTYGTSLSRHAIIKGKDMQRDARDNSYYFVWDIHHAVYDGWSMALMLQALDITYRQITDNSAAVTPTSLSPYSGFIRYIASLDDDASIKYWKTQLYGATKASFPPVLPLSQSCGTQVVSRIIDFPDFNKTGVLNATVLRAAWAIVHGAYSDNAADVTFGATVSGRQAPVPGIEKMTGPLIATVPVRIQLNKNQLISDFLKDVQHQATEMINYEQFGLQRIARISPSAKAAVDFSTLLVIQPKHIVATGGYQEEGGALKPVTIDDESHTTDQDNLSNYFTYPLVVQCHMSNKDVQLHLIYDTAYMDEAQLLRLTEQYEHVVKQLLHLSVEGKTLGDLSIAGKLDIEKAITWNKPSHKSAIETAKTLTIHGIIEAHASLRPDAIAVYSWDRVLTYKHLNALANYLANCLYQKNMVKRGEVVILHQEKSFWLPVSMLAVNKLGAAFIILDEVAVEAGQLKEIITNTRARTALCSSTTSLPVFGELLDHTIKVSTDILYPEAGAYLESDGPNIEVESSTAAYVVFTHPDNSHQESQGIVMSHKGACIGQLQFAQQVGVGPESRVGQLSKSGSILNLAEILLSMTSGATMYIPDSSAHFGKGITEFIGLNNVNWAILPTHHASLLDPADVPSLRNLILAGVYAPTDNLTQWAESTSQGRKVFGAWGSLETGIFDTLYHFPTDVKWSIGRPIADNKLWVVDPKDHRRLAAIGCSGELIVQSSSLPLDSFPDSEISTQSIRDEVPTDAQWYVDSKQKYLRTGYLVKYASDGSIIYVGSLDSGNTENILQSSVSKEIKKAIIMRTSKGTLSAFLAIDDLNTSAASTSNIFILPSAIADTLYTKLQDLIPSLMATIQAHMLPEDFILFRTSTLIMTSNGELHRDALLREYENLSQEEVSALSLATHIAKSRNNDDASLTQTEKKLRELWAKVLGLENAHQIGKQDNFFRIGGDSITTIQLVSLTQEKGLNLTVSDVFSNLKLSSMASCIDDKSGLDVEQSQVTKLSPFELLPSKLPQELVVREASKQCDVSESLITDAFPCTPLQEGLIALSEKQPGSYIARFALSLPKNVDIARFKDIMAQMYALCSNLRTRIVLVDGDKLVQIILNESITWNEIYGEEPSLGEVLKQNRESLNVTTGFGKRLSFFNLIRDASGNTHLVWDIHHSVYDGWTLGIMLDILQKLQRNAMAPESKPLSFANYVKYTLDSSRDYEAGNSFWQSQFSDANISHFPKAITHDLSDDDGNSSDSKMSHSFTLPSSSDSLSYVTLPTVLRAAWALLLSVYLDSNDVVFGNTVSGRSASIKDITSIAGPTIGTLPIRVRLHEDNSDKKSTVRQFLERMQLQSNAMIPYEHLGLQTIAKMSDRLRDACKFQNLLIIQPGGGRDVAMDKESSDEVNFFDINDLTSSSSGNTLRYHVYPLVFQCILESSESIKIDATYDKRVISPEKMKTICHHFSQAVAQLLTAASASSDILLSSISLASQYDTSMVRSWAKDDIYQIQEINERIHDLISRRSVELPNKQAIYAWDGTMSYNELEQTSTRLAYYLAKLVLKLLFRFVMRRACGQLSLCLV